MGWWFHFPGTRVVELFRRPRFPGPVVRRKSTYGLPMWYKNVGKNIYNDTTFFRNARSFTSPLGAQLEVTSAGGWGDLVEVPLHQRLARMSKLQQNSQEQLLLHLQF
jgi:hypothetical protein